MYKGCVQGLCVRECVYTTRCSVFTSGVCEGVCVQGVCVRECVYKGCV